MSEFKKDMAEVIVGSEAEFDICLEDEDGKAIPLSPYNAANLVFCNCAGVRTVVAITFPLTSPGSGIIPVLIPSSDTANADKKWKDADVELVKIAGGTKLVLLNDKFLILERHCPPAP